MNLTIKEEEIEKRIIELRKNGNDIQIICKGWNLITLKVNGKLERNLSIPEELGFDLDKDGRIKIEGED